MYDSETRIPIVDYVYGLGGSDVRLDLIRSVYDDLADIASGTVTPATLTYLGIRKEG